VTINGTLALCVVLAVLVAVMLCEPAVPGLVYRPEDEIIPIDPLPPEIPSTAHVTLELETPLI
jgi:hypothetical protein